MLEMGAESSRQNSLHSEPLYITVLVQVYQLSEEESDIALLDYTVWTADCSCDQEKAVVGKFKFCTRWCYDFLTIIGFSFLYKKIIILLWLTSPFSYRKRFGLYKC